ncbi:unnamed protein product, partial [Ectocarpus sp. 12 AP-2014]
MSLNDVRLPPPSLSRRGGSDKEDRGAVSLHGRGGERGNAAEVQDPAFARAMAEAAQAEAEIEAAEVAAMEAERLRTSRVYCEACPDDGVTEFLADGEMRGGGPSWKGLVTAVAAEYVHELPEGALVGMEAVVVSDVPGNTGRRHSAPTDEALATSGGDGKEKAV